MHGACFLAGVTAAACTAPTAFAQEKEIQGSDLPAAVQKTIDQQGKCPTVLGFSKETEHGQTIYEADLTIKGRSEDISMDANGKVVEIEEVPVDSLSDAVKQGLQDKAGKGKIGKVESLTKNGRLVAYEAKVATGTKKSEIQVGPDGKPLAA